MEFDRWRNAYNGLLEMLGEHFALVVMAVLRHCWRLCSCVLRCGRDTLPQGELSQANLLHESSGTMLNIHTEQEKSAYLRGFTGGKYENGTWKPVPDAAYGGENIGMLDWLADTGL